MPQVIYEYWVVATRPLADNGLGMTTGEAEADVGKLIEQFHLFRDERAIFDRWHQLVVQHQVTGKTGHDARLVAAMDRHGIKHLVSFNDKHFHQFPNISVIHPDGIDSLQPA
ncbi:MAG: PIN domain nuclease [Betaproteobacteria bacterium]